MPVIIPQTHKTVGFFRHTHAASNLRAFSGARVSWHPPFVNGLKIRPIVNRRIPNFGRYNKKSSDLDHCPAKLPRSGLVQRPTSGAQRGIRTEINLETENTPFLTARCLRHKTPGRLDVVVGRHSGILEYRLYCDGIISWLSITRNTSTYFIRQILFGTRPIITEKNDTS